MSAKGAARSFYIGVHASGSVSAVREGPPTLRHARWSVMKRPDKEQRLAAWRRLPAILGTPKEDWNEDTANVSNPRCQAELVKVVGLLQLLFVICQVKLTSSMPPCGG